MALEEKFTKTENISENVEGFTKKKGNIDPIGERMKAYEVSKNCFFCLRNFLFYNDVLQKA